MSIGDIIKNRRLELNLTLEQVGNACDVGKSTVRKWENGMIENMGRDKVVALSKALSINPLVLLEMDQSTINVTSSENVHFIPVPLYEPISCGTGGFVDDNIISYVPVPDDGLNPNYEYFAQVAVGDSMEDAGIDDGDILIFIKSNTISNGQIGCFCIDENIATCKKYKAGDTFIQLIPMNNKYDPIVIDINNTNFRVIGILKKAIKEF